MTRAETCVRPAEDLQAAPSWLAPREAGGAGQLREHLHNLAVRPCLGLPLPERRALPPELRAQRGWTVGGVPPDGAQVPFSTALNPHPPATPVPELHGGRQARKGT